MQVVEFLQAVEPLGASWVLIAVLAVATVSLWRENNRLNRAYRHDLREIAELKENPELPNGS